MKKRLLSCCLLIFLSVCCVYAQPQILVADAENDIIFTANLDGTGIPSALISPATGNPQGPVGIYPDFGNNLLYIADDNGSRALTAPLTGGSGTIIPNSNPPNNAHFDIYADPANGRYFFSSDAGNGVWKAPLGGVGAATRVRTSGTSSGRPHGIDYNPGTDKLYVAGRSLNRIVEIHAGTGAASPLFDAADGVSQPKGIHIDAVNGLIYWTQPGSIWVGNIDGSGTPTQLYASAIGFQTESVLIDYSTGLLYWTEFDQNTSSRVMVADADGTGTPSVLHSFNSGYLSGIEFGQAISLPQILISDAQNDLIYVANINGAGTPTALISSATGNAQGPVGMFPDFANNLLYIADQSGRRALTAPLTGGAGTVIPNSNPPNNQHFDIYADPANGRYFFTSDAGNGVWVAPINGVGAATRVRTSGASTGRPHGIDYNPATDNLYVAGRSSNRIVEIHAGTGAASPLFDAGDGVNEPRGIHIDPVNGRIYWTQQSSVWSGNLDGTGPATQLFTTGSGFQAQGVLNDYSTGLLYWVEFDQISSSRVMVANADGAGTPAVLFTFNTGFLSGIEFSQPLPQPPVPMPTLSEWGLILLGLIILAIGTVAVWRRRHAWASQNLH